MLVFSILELLRTDFGVIFEVLGVPCGALGDLWITFGLPGDPLEVQGPFYMDLGCHSGGLGTPF